VEGEGGRRRVRGRTAVGVGEGRAAVVSLLACRSFLSSPISLSSPRPSASPLLARRPRLSSPVGLASPRSSASPVGLASPAASPCLHRRPLLLRHRCPRLTGVGVFVGAKPAHGRRRNPRTGKEKPIFQARLSLKNLKRPTAARELNARPNLRF
jgi:hypothetical protein